MPTPRAPPLRRLLLYLCSTRNLVACVAALAGPVLVLLGVIRHYWVPITMGLYVAGYLATPRPPRTVAGHAPSPAVRAQVDRTPAQARRRAERDPGVSMTAIRVPHMPPLMPPPQPIHADLSPSVSFDKLLEQLDRILAQARPQLQPEAVKRLDSVRKSIEKIRPWLASDSGLGDNLDEIRTAVAHDLPETIAVYLTLPPMFRRIYRLQEGKTARQFLLLQLSAVDEEMQHVIANIDKGDSDALRINGQHMQQWFRRGRVWIRPDPLTTA